MQHSAAGDLDACVRRLGDENKLLAAATAALSVLFSVNAVSAATYTIDVNYDLLDGTIHNGDYGATLFLAGPVGAGLSDLPFTTGTIAGVSVAFTPPVSSVPLPATLPLFATGLGALGLLGWRRKKKTAAG